MILPISKSRKIKCMLLYQVEVWKHEVDRSMICKIARLVIFEVGNI